MDNLEKNIRQLVQDVIRDMNLYPPKEEAGLKKQGCLPISAKPFMQPAWLLES